MVTFSSLNLVANSYPPFVTAADSFDIIFCRNVLMYFTPELAEKIVERFHQSLCDGGWLFVSPCETSNQFFSGFTPIHFPEATFFQKRWDENRLQTSGLELEMFTPPCRPSPVPLPYPLPKIPSTSLPTVAPMVTAATLPVLPQSNNEPSPYQEALSLYELGAYTEAIEILSPLLIRNMKDTRALILLCRIYANLGRLSESLTLTTHALASGTSSADLHYLRAVILLEQGKDDESATSLRKALSLDPSLVQAHFNLANLEQRQGKREESRRHFTKALTLLDRYCPDEVIPESDGMTAKRLKEIILAATSRRQVTEDIRKRPLIHAGNDTELVHHSPKL